MTTQEGSSESHVHALPWYLFMCIISLFFKYDTSIAPLPSHHSTMEFLQKDFHLDILQYSRSSSLDFTRSYSRYFLGVSSEVSTWALGPFLVLPGVSLEIPSIFYPGFSYAFSPGNFSRNSSKNSLVILFSKSGIQCIFIAIAFFLGVSSAIPPGVSLIIPLEALLSIPPKVPVEISVESSPRIPVGVSSAIPCEISLGVSLIVSQLIYRSITGISFRAPLIIHPEFLLWDSLGIGTWVALGISMEIPPEVSSKIALDFCSEIPQESLGSYSGNFSRSTSTEFPQKFLWKSSRKFHLEFYFKLNHELPPQISPEIPAKAWGLCASQNTWCYGRSRLFYNAQTMGNSEKKNSDRKIW